MIAELSLLGLRWEVRTQINVHSRMVVLVRINASGTCVALTSILPHLTGATDARPKVAFPAMAMPWCPNRVSRTGSKGLRHSTFRNPVQKLKRHFRSLKLARQQDRDGLVVEHDIGQELHEPGVLVFQRLQPTCVGHFQAAILGLPLNGMNGSPSSNHAEGPQRLHGESLDGQVVPEVCAACSIDGRDRGTPALHRCHRSPHRIVLLAAPI